MNRNGNSLGIRIGPPLLASSLVHPSLNDKTPMPDDLWITQSVDRSVVVVNTIVPDFGCGSSAILFALGRRSHRARTRSPPPPRTSPNKVQLLICLAMLCSITPDGERVA